MKETTETSKNYLNAFKLVKAETFAGIVVRPLLWKASLGRDTLNITRNAIG